MRKLILLILGFDAMITLFCWLSSCQPSKPKAEYKETTAERVNNSLKEYISAKVDSAEQTIIAHLDSVSLSKQAQKSIVNNYTTVYEKISIAHDSSQLAITTELLAKHKRTPVKRD